MSLSRDNNATVDKSTDNWLDSAMHIDLLHKEIHKKMANASKGPAAVIEKVSSLVGLRSRNTL